MRQPIGLHATNQNSAALFAAVEQLQPTAVLILDGLVVDAIENALDAVATIINNGVRIELVSEMDVAE